MSGRPCRIRRLYLRSISFGEEEHTHMAQIRGVILDVDGTLVDSNDAHAHAWVAAMAEYGYAVPFEEVRRLIGMGGDKLLPITTGVEKDSEIGQQIDRRRKELFAERYLPHIKAFPNVRRLVQRIQAAGLQVAVASSAQGDQLAALLELTDSADLLEQRTSSSDAEQSKPDPDIVAAALERMNLPADQVIMLGDTPYDIESAGKLGVRVIALRCGGWDAADLTGAIAVYDEPADLLKHYDASPLA